VSYYWWLAMDGTLSVRQSARGTKRSSCGGRGYAASACSDLATMATRWSTRPWCGGGNGRRGAVKLGSVLLQKWRKGRGSTGATSREGGSATVRRVGWGPRPVTPALARRSWEGSAKQGIECE
jgi:hypothetical protein